MEATTYRVAEAPTTHTANTKQVVVVMEIGLRHYLTPRHDGVILLPLANRTPLIAIVLT
jgi:hypothetical protein